MPMFDYEALTPSGRLMRGQFEADSAKTARMQLMEMDWSIRRLEPTPAGNLVTDRPLGRDEFLLFNEQLASLAEAGVPLEKGLREVASDVSSRRLRSTLEQVADDISSGKSVDEALAAQPRRFPPMYRHLVAAGVQSGRLGQMLVSLNRHLLLRRETRHLVREALAYPLTVITLTVLIALGVLAFILPEYVAMFKEMEFALSEALRTAAAAGRWLRGWPWAFAGVAAGLAAAGVIVATLPGLARLREWLLVKLPVMGSLHRRCVLAEFTDALSVLVAAGTGLDTALDLCADASRSPRVADDARQMAETIRHGGTDSENPYRLFPDYLLYTINVGTRRNELDHHLRNLAAMYRDQAGLQQKHLRDLMGPLMLVVLAVVVGGAIVGMMLPLIQLLQFMGSGPF